MVNVRNPYLLSSLTHVAVLTLLATLSSWTGRSFVVDGVDIVMPPPGDGGAVAAPPSQETSEPRPPARPAPDEPETQPEPLPEPAAEKPVPKPEIVPENKAQKDGVLPPVKDTDVPSRHGEVPQQPDEAPQPQRNQPPISTPEEAPPSNVAPGSGPAGRRGGGVGVEGGVLGAHAPWYLVQLQDKLGNNWRRPANVGRSGTVVAKAHFFIRPDGSVSDVELVESSDNRLFDQSILRSIHNSVPLPPIPAELATRTIGITVTFEQTY